RGAGQGRRAVRTAPRLHQPRCAGCPAQGHRGRSRLLAGEAAGPDQAHGAGKLPAVTGLTQKGPSSLSAIPVVTPSDEMELVAPIPLVIAASAPAATA